MNELTYLRSVLGILGAFMAAMFFTSFLMLALPAEEDLTGWHFVFYFFSWTCIFIARGARGVVLSHLVELEAAMKDQGVDAPEDLVM